MRRMTYNITENRKIELEKLAINISVKTGKLIKWSELLTYLIDEYSKEAADDFIDRTNKKP